MSKHEHLDKTYDDKFKTQWLPWVGKDYNKSSKRLLIVGESHYAWGSNDEEYNRKFYAAKNSQDFTRNCIYEACVERIHWTNKTYDNLHRALLRTNNFDYKALWENVCFYNFIPRLMDYRVKEQPQWADFYSSWKTFMEIIEILQPTECVFIGVHASNSFDLAMSELGVNYNKIKWHSKINGTYPRTATINLPNGKIKISFIKHSSQMFSWKTWNDFLKSQTHDTLQYLKNKVNGVPEIEDEFVEQATLKGLPTHLSHKPILALNYRAFTDNPKNDARYLTIGRAQYNNSCSSIKLWRSIGGKWSRQSEEVPIYRVADFALMLTSTIEKVIEKNDSPEFTPEVVSQEDLSFLEDEIILNKESIVCSLKKLKTILNRIELEKL